MSRRAAALQLAFVVLVDLAWLIVVSTTELFAGVSGEMIMVAHVAANGAVALGLVFFATWSDPSRALSLGLRRVAFLPEIGWGLVGFLACYFASTAALLLYVIVTRIGEHAAPILVAGGPGDIFARELANKARWGRVLG